MSSNIVDPEQDNIITPSFEVAASTSAGTSPLRNAETFEAYCTEVQEKLGAHAMHRMNFLQAAFDRLTNLLQAARDVEDTELCSELAQHRNASRELLDAVRRSSGISSPPAVTSVQRPLVTPVFNRPTPVPIVPSVSQLSRRAETVATVAIPPGLTPTDVTPASATGPRVPRRPMRPLIDIEADAVALRQDLKEWVKSTL